MSILTTDAIISSTTGKLWSEIEVSDDEFLIEAAEVVKETYRPSTVASSSGNRQSSRSAAEQLYGSSSSGRHQQHGRRGGNRRENNNRSMPSSRGTSSRMFGSTRPAASPVTASPTTTSDAPRRRRFANISSLEMLLEWPRQTSSPMTNLKEAAAPPTTPPFSSTESTSAPSSNESNHEESSVHDERALTPNRQPLHEECDLTPSRISTPNSSPNHTSEPLSTTAASAPPSPEPTDPPFCPDNKATDGDICSRTPATFEGRMRGWNTPNQQTTPITTIPTPPTPSEAPSDTECASQESETARPLEGHMTEEDGDVIFHEPFEIWYTLPSGGARKGINKEVYEGGMHKIGTFTRVSEFFEFHRMLDWNTLPPNSVIAFCRENIRPIWEDPANELGGRYLVKNFPRDDTEAIFTKTALGFFSGLFHDWKNYNLVSLHIRDVRRGNDIQLWRRTTQSALSAGIVKDDILSITSEERPANLMVSFVPNRESLYRNDEKLAYNSGSRKNRSGRGGNGRRSPVGSATVESVFGSSAAARSVSSLYSKGKVFSLSAEEKERMVEDCAQEAARIGAKLSESMVAPVSPRSGVKQQQQQQQSESSRRQSSSGSSQQQDDEIVANSPRISELSRESMGEALASLSSHSSSPSSSRRSREPIPDMVHPAQLMATHPPMMGYYYVPATVPLFAGSTTGANCPKEEKETLLEGAVAEGAPARWDVGYPVYWSPGEPAPMYIVDPQYAYYPSYAAGWGAPVSC